MNDDRSNRRSTSIGVDKDLARMITVICVHRGCTHAELITPMIRDIIEGQYAIVSAEIQREVKERKERKARNGGETHG